LPGLGRGADRRRALRRQDLSGLNVGLLLEIPGLMARGNWTAAAFIDDRASPAAHRALVDIFSGKARGTTGLFGVLVSQFLGAESAPVTFETEGATRRLTVGRKIQGEVVPVRAPTRAQDIVVRNTKYWMGADITVATATRAGCAHSAGCGISTAAAPRSARSTGRGRADDHADYCRTMADYNAWQNESLLAAADGLSDVARKKDRGAFFSSIAGTLSHLLWADLVWMSRFTGVEAPQVGHADSPTLWPDWGPIARRGANRTG
jgi:hypothetical protein